MFRKLAIIFTALAFVVALSGCNSLVQSGGNDGDSGGGQDNQQSSSQGSEQSVAQPDSPEQSAQQGGESTQAAQGPSDTTLGLSIPKLGKDFSGVPTGRGDDEQLLTDNAVVHVYPTGFPWQEGANTYFAGHVAGYQGTPSYKALEGVDQLQNGDDIVVTDADGKKYTYKVFKNETITPQQTEVLNPVAGKSIVTIQTCEIINYNADGTPDYNNTDRTIIQAELQS